MEKEIFGSHETEHPKIGVEKVLILLCGIPGAGKSLLALVLKNYFEAKGKEH
jgi:SpoVK/Ycf46/Vps4 family AAA+-type ATPase